MRVFQSVQIANYKKIQGTLHLIFLGKIRNLAIYLMV